MHKIFKSQLQLFFYFFLELSEHLSAFGSRWLRIWIFTGTFLVLLEVGVLFGSRPYYQFLLLQCTIVISQHFAKLVKSIHVFSMF